MLAGYEYKIKYKPGQSNSNADVMSRLPKTDPMKDSPVPTEIIHIFEHLEGTSVATKQIKLWTFRDVLLGQVLGYTMNGWPVEVDNLKSYYSRKAELSVQDGCLLWKNCVIIPPQGRAAVLQELHESHRGVSRMKTLARMYVWRPGIDSYLEMMARKYKSCEKNHKKHRNVSLHPWEWPAKPWTRLHMEYAGPFMGHMFLVLVNATFKWIEIKIVNKADSESTREVLLKIFMTHRMPKELSVTMQRYLPVS